MVLDCGGGTVDITVHKLKCEPEEQFVCDELLPSSGGCEWGSKFVDHHFEMFLQEFFGPELTDCYYKNATARLDILKHFEMLKRKFNSGVKSRLQLSYLNEELTGPMLKKIVQQYNEPRPKEQQLTQKGASGVELPETLMKSFFHPLFQKIEDKVAELLQDAEKTGSPVNFIFMVGGFSESPYLKASIKNKFEKDNLTILVPKRPQVSVIRGACMFGLNPRSITSRISKKTYGINTLTTFDNQRHTEEKKVIIEGEDFCEDVFDAFVTKGQAVGIDEVHVKTYCPVRARQTVMRIIFYCSDQENVNYIDDTNVTKLGELSIDIGRPFQSVEDKTVKVTLIFGSTQIHATATNKEGTEIRNCEFQFETAGTANPLPQPKGPQKEEEKQSAGGGKNNKALNSTNQSSAHQTTQDQTQETSNADMTLGLESKQ